MKNRNASAVLVAATTFALTAALIAAGCPPSAETRVWKTLPKPAALPMADESGLAPVDDIQ